MTYTEKIFIYITLVLLAISLQAQQVEKSTSGSFALTNATIETITEGTKTGTVLIQNGKINIYPKKNTIDLKNHFSKKLSKV